MTTTKYQSGLRVSEYLLEECLGAGTFGEVWRARHHVWKSEEVAIKLPTEPQYVRFLQREGTVVHGLRHPNIIRVMGFDPYADPPYLVMELVRGPSLKAVIAEHKKSIPFDVVVTILRGMLNAMSAAHSAHILHRDLKPGNVMLHLEGKPLDSVRVGAVKVGDFGLGADNEDALRTLSQSASLARDDQLVGTLAYMAPESREGTQRPDARADLFAIGVMLFELLTGERPAGAEVPSSLRPGTPTALDEIFRRLYCRLDRRYASAAVALSDLTQHFVDRDAVPVPPPPLPTGARTHATRSRACPHCRAAVAPDDQYCTQCGGQIAAQVRRCPACQGYPRPHDRFCIFCGTTLVVADPA